MAAKRLRIEQGEFIFEFYTGNRHAWINKELAKRWQAFVTDLSPVDVEVVITCYDPKKQFNWPASRLNSFRKIFRNVLDRFPFKNSDNGNIHPPEKILTKLAPDNRFIKAVSDRIRQNTRLIFANTDTGLFFFDPSENRLFIFTEAVRPPIPLLSGFTGRLPLKRATLITDISNGVMLALSWLLIHDGGLLLHGAGVQKLKQAVLFLGVSGAGKSTAARNCAPDFCFSDDGVILKKIEAGTFIFASVFSQVKGPLYQPIPRRTKLQKLFLLNKSDRNRTEPLDKNLLMNHILLHLIHFFRYFDEETAEKAFENVLEIVEELQAFRLDFTKDRKEWKDVWQAPGKRKNTNHRS